MPTKDSIICKKQSQINKQKPKTYKDYCKEMSNYNKIEGKLTKKYSNFSY